METIVSIRVFDSFDPTKEYHLFSSDHETAKKLVSIIQKSNDWHKETGLPFSKLNYIAYDFHEGSFIPLEIL